MKKNDRMTLILGEAVDLKGAVDAYMEAQKEADGTILWWALTT